MGANQGGPENTVMTDLKRRRVARKFGADAYFELLSHTESVFGVDKDLLPGTAYEGTARLNVITPAQIDTQLGKHLLYHLMSIYKEFRILRCQFTYSSPALIKKTIASGVVTDAVSVAGTVDLELANFPLTYHRNSNVFGDLNNIESLGGVRDKRMNLSATSYPSQGHFVKCQVHWPRVNTTIDIATSGTATAGIGQAKSQWISCSLTDAVHNLFLERWHNLAVTDKVDYPATGAKLDLV